MIGLPGLIVAVLAASGSGYVFYKMGHAVGHFQGKTAGIKVGLQMVQAETDKLNAKIEADNAVSEAENEAKEARLASGARDAKALVDIPADVRAMCKAKCSMPTQVRVHLKALN